MTETRTPPPATRTPATPEQFVSVQHFLNRQMQLLDDGRAADWAATFTEDGVFAQDTRPEGRRGRAVLAERMEHHAGVLAARGLTRRHWIGMLSVERSEDGEDQGQVRARYYAIVVDTPADGEAALHLSTVCDDVLVPDGDGWLVAHRYIHHDNHRP
ncbi:nuclear transport factor 2 family protein [Streptomyces sp. NPDC001056]